MLPSLAPAPLRRPRTLRLVAPRPLICKPPLRKECAPRYVINPARRLTTNNRRSILAGLKIGRQLTSHMNGYSAHSTATGRAGTSNRCAIRLVGSRGHTLLSSTGCSTEPTASCRTRGATGNSILLPRARGCAGAADQAPRYEQPGEEEPDETPPAVGHIYQHGGSDRDAC